MGHKQNEVPFESGVQQPQKEESFFPAEHAEGQAMPEILTDTANEGLSGSEVSREDIMPASAEEEQREEQAEQFEEPVFSAELDEEQTAPESLAEAASEEEKSEEPSDSTVYNHHENAAEGAESPFVQEEQMEFHQEEPSLFTDHQHSFGALDQAETEAEELEEPSDSIINNQYDIPAESKETKIDVQPDSHTELEETDRMDQASKPLSATHENRQEIRAGKPHEASKEPKPRPGVKREQVRTKRTFSKRAIRSF